MLTLRRSALLLALAALAACSQPKTIAPTDAGTPPVEEKCEAIDGFFLTQREGADCNSYRASLPQAICIVQQGCDLTVDTGTQRLTGKAVGRKFTVSSDTPVHTECAGEIADAAMQVKCTTTVPLSREPYVCDFPTTRLSSTDASGYCCDPIAQNCGGGDRCNLVALATNRDPLAAVCVPTKGTAGDGEDCQRFGSDDNNAGDDDCAEGLFCSRVGVSNDVSRQCRRICTNETQCGEGRMCYGVMQVPVAGFCLPTCSLFGTDCMDGTTCRRMGALDAKGASVQRTACSATGAVAIGTKCSSDNDCPADAVCNYQPGERNLKCRTLCDADHACGTGFRCVPFDPTSADPTGVCAAAK